MSSKEEALRELLTAINHRDLALTTTLLKQGRVDLNEKLSCYNLPIHCAHSIEFLKLLVSHGADPDKADHNGETPVMQWAWRGAPCELEYLIGLGASLDKKDHSGKTALDHARIRPNNKKGEEIILKALRKREQKAPQENEQKRIALLRDTAARKQAGLRKHLPKTTMRPS